MSQPNMIPPGLVEELRACEAATRGIYVALRFNEAADRAEQLLARARRLAGKPQRSASKNDPPR